MMQFQNYNVLGGLSMKKLIILSFVVLSFFLGGCSLIVDERIAADADSSDAVSVKVGEINDVFSSSGGRTEELHIYSDRSAEIEGYLDKDTFDSFVELSITKNGAVEGATYTFIIKEKESHQEALERVQSDYESLCQVVNTIEGAEGLSSSTTLPSDFIDDFVKTENNALTKHYGGDLDEEYMQDISFNDNLLKISVGHQSRG